MSSMNNLHKFLGAPNSASQLHSFTAAWTPGGLAELGAVEPIAVGWPEWRPGPGWTVAVGRQRLHLSGLRQCTKIAGAPNHIFLTFLCSRKCRCFHFLIFL